MTSVDRDPDPSRDSNTQKTRSRQRSRTRLALCCEDRESLPEGEVLGTPCGSVGREHLDGTIEGDPDPHRRLPTACWTGATLLDAKPRPGWRNSLQFNGDGSLGRHRHLVAGQRRRSSLRAEAYVTAHHLEFDGDVTGVTGSIFARHSAATGRLPHAS